MDYSTIMARLPVVFALVALLFGGTFLLDRADKQARDTVRKHHLQDLEDSLYLARNLHGTFPPYNQPSWCGLLNDSANSQVKAEIETALRQRVEKYSNPAKPFPSDPIHSGEKYDYFYWKRSPAVFELYAILEADHNNNRNTIQCPSAPSMYYDYGINSSLRDNA